MDINTLGETLGPLTSVMCTLLLLEVHRHFFGGKWRFDHSGTNATGEIQHHSGGKI